METHSTVEAPPKDSKSNSHTVLSSLIALLTLALPLYITAHYSSSIVVENTPTLSSSAAPLRLPLRVYEGSSSL
ncbi:hypothetical protein [Altericista sp. CCNU0014]|uniref:hypothetical protein n=1 Tax=Altericista sp. CCNU0014 TaxID=3082949 RepID=UPI00384D9756